MARRAGLYHFAGHRLPTPDLESKKDCLLKAQNKIEMLIDKTDQTLGSVTYMANEYDDLLMKINKLTKNYQNLLNDQDQIQKRIGLLDRQVDRLEQYGRRENLEIHGVPQMKKENTNQIVKSIAKYLIVSLDNLHISSSHRLPLPSKHNTNPQ